MNDKEKMHIVMANSEHPYQCRCDNCLKWWLIMGPDGDCPDDFGPFSAEEIRQAAERYHEPFYNGSPESE